MVMTNQEPSVRAVLHTADLVSVDHKLRQFVNVKGD